MFFILTRDKATLKEDDIFSKKGIQRIQLKMRVAGNIFGKICLRTIKDICI